MTTTNETLAAGPALSLCYVTVTVDDQDTALAFYRDVLGLQPHSDVSMGEFRWLTLVAPGTPGVQLVLGDPRTDTRAADAPQILDMLAKGSLSTLFFESDDIDATFERIRAAGAEVVQEPVDQPYGERDCAFRDPSGNMIRFHQRIDRPPMMGSIPTE